MIIFVFLLFTLPPLHYGSALIRRRHFFFPFHLVRINLRFSSSLDLKLVRTLLYRVLSEDESKITPHAEFFLALSYTRVLKQPAMKKSSLIPDIQRGFIRHCVFNPEMSYLR